MIYKSFKYFVYFAIMLFVGVLSFNLFHINEKLRMLQVISDFHCGQLADDKKVLDDLLTDNFTESGVNDSVQESKIAYKSDLVNFDYAKTNVESIEVHYWFISNVLSSNDKSLSFVRTVNFLPQDGKIPPSFSYFVTYTFEKNGSEMKINHIERKF